MFQAVSPPIIRSAKLYIQRKVLSNQYCCVLNKMQRFLDLFISVNCSTCFARFLRPSSGATKLYIQRQVLSNQYCCVLNKMQRFLDLFIFVNCSTCFRRFLRPSSGAQNCTYSVSSFSSTIAGGSSIGLTIPDAVCKVLCSWWWAEEPPETCRAIYRNK